jgi:hypothetical protein
MIYRDGNQAVVIKGVVPRSIGNRLVAHEYFCVTHCNDGKSMFTARINRPSRLGLARDSVFALVALIDPNVREY